MALIPFLSIRLLSRRSAAGQGGRTEPHRPTTTPATPITPAQKRRLRPARHSHHDTSGAGKKQNERMPQYNRPRPDLQRQPVAIAAFRAGSPNSTNPFGTNTTTSRHRQPRFRQQHQRKGNSANSERHPDERPRDPARSIHFPIGM